VDVFEASVDQHSAIWVNGDKFELSPDAIGYAEGLQQSWSDLGSLAERWRATRTPVAQGDTRPTRVDFATCLVALDMAWAQFECKYISELIAIEEQARQFIVKAVNYESQLRFVPKGSSDFQESERSLVACIAHLNSVANFKRKGRDDLSCNILESARDVMHRCATGQIRGAARDAAQILASDVVAAFDAMRSYLAEVSTCIERVDPHLCNNVGLVARLVDWEESWEIGLRYVQQADMFEAVIGVVSEFTAAQTMCPALITMCEDCDVELFLVLPRIVLLSFLSEPSSKRTELVKSLIPHRFGASEDGSVASLAKMHPDLQTLIDHYNETVCIVENKPFGASPATKGVAWEVFVKRAVLGPGDSGDIYGGHSLQSQKAVEDLMREVERWSLEVQRHCPEDWNQFSAVLVQCLTGGSPKDAAPQFEV